MSGVMEDCSISWHQKPGNPFLPTVERLNGRTASWLEEADRSLCRDGTSVIRVKYDDRYTRQDSLFLCGYSVWLLCCAVSGGDGAGKSRCTCALSDQTNRSVRLCLCMLISFVTGVLKQCLIRTSKTIKMVVVYARPAEKKHQPPFHCKFKLKNF